MNRSRRLLSCVAAAALLIAAGCSSRPDMDELAEKGFEGFETGPIAGMKYDRVSGRLVLVFETGQQHEYLRVPADIYERLRRSDSKGKIFDREIKDKYENNELLQW